MAVEKIIFWLFTVAIVHGYVLVGGVDESVLVVAVPHNSGSEVPLSSERKQEILQGALEAVNDIKSDQFSLLSLVVADSGSLMRYDSLYLGNVLNVLANLTSKSTKIFGVAGFFHPKLLAILQSFKVRIASLIHFNENLSSSNVFYMTASNSVLIDSLVAFLRLVNQTRIIAITETDTLFHLKLLHKLNSEMNVSLRISVTTHHHHRELFASIIKAVAESNVNTILLNVRPFHVLPIMCEAHKSGLTWSKYVWILHSYRLSDIPQDFDLDCSKQTVLEGMFIFQLIQEHASVEDEISNDTDIGRGHVNPYANLMYDAVLVLAEAANQSMESYDFNSIHKTSQYVYIYQILNGTSRHVGIYGSESKKLENISIDTFTKKDLPVLQIIPSPYYLVLPALCFLLNSLLLVLYIYYRNKPSVKSTSVSLSLLLFTGCYLLISFTVMTIADIPPSIDLCMLFVWLSGLGISLPLILTTVLVKMLRVYRIFSLYKKVKSKAYTSECAHFIYTFIILMPNITVLVVWSAFDPLRSDDVYVENPGFIIIEERCVSDYAAVWFVLLLAYNILLSLAVVIVAIKSRKIRMSQFKDTKKVNFLIFSVLFVGCSTFAYSSIFAVIGEYHLISYFTFCTSDIFL